MFAAFVGCDLNSLAGKGFGADGICWTFSNSRRIEELIK